jgi:hypothetical protein
MGCLSMETEMDEMGRLNKPNNVESFSVETEESQ